MTSTLRFVAFTLAVVVALGSAAPVLACARDAAMPCCAGEEAPPDRSARLSRACCCVEPGDADPARRADAISPRARGGDELAPLAPAAAPALLTFRPLALPAGRHSSI